MLLYGKYLHSLLLCQLVENVCPNLKPSIRTDIVRQYVPPPAAQWPKFIGVEEQLKNLINYLPVDLYL